MFPGNPGDATNKLPFPPCNHVCIKCIDRIIGKIFAVYGTCLTHGYIENVTGKK